VKLILTNFGYKQYTLSNKPFPKADLYIDCRGLTDRASEGVVKATNGPLLFAMKTTIEEAHHTINTRWGANPNRDFTVALFCAHGMNRSVAAKAILADTIDRNIWPNIEVR